MTRARHYDAVQQRSRGNRAWLSWLELSRYDAIASWDLHDWMQQMTARAALWNKVAGGQSLSTREVEDIQQRPLAAGGQRVWLSIAPPVGDLSYQDFQWLNSAYTHPLIAEAVRAWEEQAHSQLGALERLISRAGSQERTGPHLHPQTLAVLRTLLEKEEREVDEVVTSAPFLTAYLRLDLSATDANLREWFAAWLKSRRELMRTVAPRSGRDGGPFKHLRGTKAERSRWRRLKIVPYIDAMILARHEQRKMPTAVAMGERLFPSRKNPDAVVRQQTSKVARQLLRDGAANHLRNLVMAQQVKKSESFSYP